MAQPIEISDPADPRLADFRDLTHVDRRPDRPGGRGLVIAEGVPVVRRLLASPYPLRAVLGVASRIDVLASDLAAVQPAAGQAPVYVASAEVMATVVGFHLNRGVLASADRLPTRPVEDLLTPAARRSSAWPLDLTPANARRSSAWPLDLTPASARRGFARPLDLTPASPRRGSARPLDIGAATRIAVLEGVNDHENLGSIFRNAAALGVDAVLLGPGCADPLYRRAVRVSMGHVLGVPFTTLAGSPPFAAWPGAISELQAAGFSVLAMTPRPGSLALRDLDPARHPRTAVLLGAEGPGLSEQALAAADLQVRIPIRAGVDSINVATAAAIAFAHLSTLPLFE